MFALSQVSYAAAVRSPLLLACLAAAACAPRAPARTLGPGHAEVATSFGGPLFANLGPTIPLPMLAVGGRYGVADKLDVSADANITSAVYGVGGGDVGATYQLVRTPGNALAGTARIDVFSDGSALRIFPELALVADHRFCPRWSAIYGVTTLIQPSPPRDKPYALTALSAGIESAIGNGALALDLAWISPWQDSTSVVDWQPGHGAIMVRVGYRRGVR